jgi:hypothetical protein
MEKEKKKEKKLELSDVTTLQESNRLTTQTPLSQDTTPSGYWSSQLGVEWAVIPTALSNCPGTPETQSVYSPNPSHTPGVLGSQGACKALERTKRKAKN